jgi:UDP-2,3-diacylglucosamine hydrolase
LKKKTKIYFASDQHLGAPDEESSKKRELLFLSWLDEVKKDASAIFLLGDLFDFWFEYEKVVPKGFVRILGKLAEIKDSGISIYYFVGNHDLWMDGYFENELNIPVFHEPQVFEFDSTTFFIGHGDGKGPGDMGYKRMKKVFVHPISKFLFKWIHPDLGVALAQYLSVKNKLISGSEDIHFLGKENEWLVQYAQRKLSCHHYDFFIFGHRHLPMKISLSEKSTYINLGDWVSYFTYGVFEDKKFTLQYYKTGAIIEDLPL